MTSLPDDKPTSEAGVAEPAAEAPGVAGDDGGDGELAAVVEDDEELAPEQQIAALEAEKKETYDRLLRATADLDNLRKRSRREVADARTDARSQVLRDVLPVIDNLERALAHAETSAESIVEGVKLVMRQFANALEKNQVKPVEAQGQPFDPNLHEAMSQIETADAAPGSVVQVLQTGYTIGDKLLRPAMVVVAKAPPQEEPAAGANGKSAVADEGAEGEKAGDGGDAVGGDDES